MTDVLSPATSYKTAVPSFMSSQLNGTPRNLRVKDIPASITKSPHYSNNQLIRPGTSEMVKFRGEATPCFYDKSEQLSMPIV